MPLTLGMAVCEIHLGNKNVLRKMTSCMVILPENAGPGPFPVFYLLHGLSDDHTTWTRRTCLERYLEGWPMIVVMPDGGRGWYTDSSVEPTGAFETFILRDLIGFIDATFRTRPERASRVISGLSMGGYGAVKLALKYPGMFCAAASHSGALVNPEDRGGDYLGSELHRIFGDSPTGGANDVFALAQKLEVERRPALRIDCGLQDSLLEHNRHFHHHLESLGFPHEYAEFPGGHTWAYWDEHVREAIAFFARILRLRRGPVGSG
jgi:S-formylglutathione hydrolase FrmB